MGQGGVKKQQTSNKNGGCLVCLAIIVTLSIMIFFFCDPFSPPDASTQQNPPPSAPPDPSSEHGTIDRTQTSTAKIEKTPEAEKKYQEYVVIDKAVSAPLRPVPGGEDSLIRIPAGKKIQVLEKREVRSGSVIITWYKVKHKGQTGWISQYVTMGEMIKEPIGGGKAVAERIPYSDGPRILPFDQEAKRNWVELTLKDSAVKEIKFAEGSDRVIRVVLMPEKYEAGLPQRMAGLLANSYYQTTRFQGGICIKILDMDGQEVVFKGYYSPNN